jgi:hypothetical protein
MQSRKITEVAMTDANELLLPALLAMDVYHRDVEGGLYEQVKPLEPSIDGANPFDFKYVEAIGFFAKAYEKDGTIYIAYRGTDDGSLDVQGNTSKVLLTIATGSGLKDLALSVCGRLAVQSCGIQSRY